MYYVNYVNYVYYMINKKNLDLPLRIRLQLASANWEFFKFLGGLKPWTKDSVILDFAAKSYPFERDRVRVNRPRHPGTGCVTTVCVDVEPLMRKLYNFWVDRSLPSPKLTTSAVLVLIILDCHNLWRQNKRNDGDVDVHSAG